MSGGWKWINIPYEEQLKIKQEQVIESFKSIENKLINDSEIELSNEEKHKKLRNLFLPIESSPIID
jgi:tRNA/tmRNA/rRNA uracil-C5-methylase (TrmA/RlmC/RlmD family)